jgi:hypothetical protein
MKQDTNWIVVSTSYNPLPLYELIKKTILAQMEDQYLFATVYNQEAAFYSFRLDSLSNPQWYEHFNTKVNVGKAISMTRQHKVLLEYVAQERHQQAFTTLGVVDQQAIHTDAEEQYVSYAFLQQSGTQSGNLNKVDLQNDYTTGDNQYPKNRQQSLHLLDKYSKTGSYAHQEDSLRACHLHKKRVAEGMIRDPVEGLTPKRVRLNPSTKYIGRTRNASNVTSWGIH